MNRRQIQRDFETINRRYENKYFGLVKSALMPSGLTPVIRTNGLAAGITFLNRNVANSELSNVIRELYREVGLKHAQINYTRLRNETRGAKRIPFFNSQKSFGSNLKDILETKAGFGNNPVWERFILQYLQRFLLEKITFEVTTTTRNKMVEVLQEAIREGLGIDETVKRLESIPLNQAARIVRTEINRAANVGAKAQSETFGYEQMKEWISAHDTRVRGFDPKDHASHIDLDGQKINEDDLFQDSRNGDLLEFPGDPRASAASTINCRCSIAYTAKRDQNGRLIPKRKTTTVIFPNQNRQRQIILV